MVRKTLNPAKGTLRSTKLKSPNRDKGANTPHGKVTVTLGLEPDDYMTLSEMNENQSVGTIIRDIIHSLLTRNWSN